MELGALEEEMNSYGSSWTARGIPGWQLRTNQMSRGSETCRSETAEVLALAISTSVFGKAAPAKNGRSIRKQEEALESPGK